MIQLSMCEYMNLCTSGEEFVHTKLQFYSTVQNRAGKKKPPTEFCISSEVILKF